MKHDLYFSGKIVEVSGKKKLEITTPTLYERILNSLKEGEVSLTITPKKKQRSIPQNSFYWLYLNVSADETGDDEVSLHEYFKRTLLPPKYITALKKKIKIPASTTELSKSDMSEYMMRIATLTEIPIPDPETAGYISNNKPYER